MHTSRILRRDDLTLQTLYEHNYCPNKARRRFAPDYCIRVYHGARLAEARLDLNLPLRELRAAKLAHNRALAEWLDYCRRHRYRLHNTALTAPLNIA